MNGKEHDSAHRTEAVAKQIASSKDRRLVDDGHKLCLPEWSIMIRIQM